MNINKPSIGSVALEVHVAPVFFFFFFNNVDFIHPIFKFVYTETVSSMQSLREETIYIEC